MQIDVNGLALEVDDRGPIGAPPLLLIAGLGMQMTMWSDELVGELIARGFRVIRFDNRDSGLSTGFDGLGKPNLAFAGMRYALHLPVTSPYSLQDMAGDALGVMQVLGIESAHVCGASMGGMIAQRLAAWRPERVRSLTLMMTTTGARRLPQPALHVRRVLLSRPSGRDTQAVVAHLEHVLSVIGSPAYPYEPERLRQRVQAMVQRALRPAGTARQLLAVVADGDRSALVARITAPTRIIHGREDPLVPVEAGRDLAARIPGAVADIIPGMGHDLPPQLLQRFADGIQQNAARAA